MNFFNADLSHLFAKETEELRVICELISPDITDNEFDECCFDIENTINKSYKNESNDIEDMGDIIMGIDLIIKKMWTNKENVDKFFELLVLRKKAKKLSHKKFREGHDWYYHDKIEKGIMKPKIKYSDEKPRDFWNVEECVFQYMSLVKYVWEPSTKKIKEDYGKYYKNNDAEN